MKYEEILRQEVVELRNRIAELEAQLANHSDTVALDKLESILRGPSTPTINLVPIGLVDDPSYNLFIVETDGMFPEELSGRGTDLRAAIAT